MRKDITILMLLVLLIQPILAIDLEINKVSSKEVLIYGLNNEATFELEITNSRSGINSLEFSFNAEIKYSTSSLL